MQTVSRCPQCDEHARYNKVGEFACNYCDSVVKVTAHKSFFGLRTTYKAEDIRSKRINHLLAHAAPNQHLTCWNCGTSTVHSKDSLLDRERSSMTCPTCAAQSILRYNLASFVPKHVYRLVLRKHQGATRFDARQLIKLNKPKYVYDKDETLYLKCPHCQSVADYLESQVAANAGTEVVCPQCYAVSTVVACPPTDTLKQRYGLALAYEADRVVFKVPRATYRSPNQKPKGVARATAPYIKAPVKETPSAPSRTSDTYEASTPLIWPSQSTPTPTPEPYTSGGGGSFGGGGATSSWDSSSDSGSSDSGSSSGD